MRTSRFIFVLALVLLAGCASQKQDQATVNAGPKPDGRLQMTTTSIAPGMGLSWADARVSFNYIDYNFAVEALTITESDVRFTLSGQQLTIYGNVYKMKNISDFAGTYTRATPEVAAAVGGGDRYGVFQNAKGVIVRVTGKFVPGPLMGSDDLDTRLMHDNFKVTFKDL